MASNSETGHVVNISNFKLILDKITGLGAPYNPGNAEITIASMNTIWTNADAAQLLLNQVFQQAKEPINQREILFEPLDQLSTRMVNYLNSTPASAQLKKDAKGLADKIRGIYKGPNPAPVPPDDPAGVSQSQQSYVQRATNFKSLIDLLSSTPLYAPNEVDLQIVSLTALYNQMKVANDGIGVILNPAENARITRNNLLYAPNIGMIDIAQKCKKYVKGVYGSKAQEYKLVSGIKLRKVKI